MSESALLGLRFSYVADDGTEVVTTDPDRLLRHPARRLLVALPQVSGLPGDRSRRNLHARTPPQQQVRLACGGNADSHMWFCCCCRCRISMRAGVRGRAPRSSRWADAVSAGHEFCDVRQSLEIFGIWADGRVEQPPWTAAGMLA